MNLTAALEILRDYIASNPAGEHVVPIELEDCTTEDLDRFVSETQRIRAAVTDLAQAAKDIIVTRAGQTDKSGTRHAVRIGSRAYVGKEAPVELGWVDEAKVVDFLTDRGGGRAVAKTCLIRPRGESVIRRYVTDELDVDWSTFRDTFMSERVGNPRVELIDLNYQGAPKWAGALPDYLDIGPDCG